MNKVNVLYDNLYQKMCTYLQDYYPVSEELNETLFRLSAIQNFKKGELLVSEDWECNNLYFIIRGFCSCYYNKDGKEFVMRYIKEGDFGLLFHAFLGKKKALLNIKATENTDVLCLNRDNFEYLRNNFKDFALLFYNVVERFVIEHEEMYYRMRSNDAQERVKHYKDAHHIQFLLQHVPQYSIATFLNMTPETFAKIWGQENKKT